MSITLLSATQLPTDGSQRVCHAFKAITEFNEECECLRQQLLQSKIAQLNVAESVHRIRAADITIEAINFYRDKHEKFVLFITGRHVAVLLHGIFSATSACLRG